MTVSLLTGVIATLALGACAGTPSPSAWDAPSETTVAPLTLRFDNGGQTYVDVYLVTQLGQWRLGRVAPGARSTLRIPHAALAPSSGFVRLAVLADAPVSLDAAHDPRATFTIAQSPSQLLAQRWTFWKTPLASPEIIGAPVDARPR